MNRNFEDIYKKINLENLEEINLITKRKNLTLVILLILALLLIFLNKIIFINNAITVIYFLIFLFTLLINIKVTIRYKKMFKERIIKKIVKLYDEEFSYNPNMGILRSEYVESGFYKDFDKYYSEDLIKGKIHNKYSFQMAQVRTKKTEVLRDDRGKITGKEDHIVFNGLYGVVDLDNTNLLEINVATNTIISKYKNSRIEMDSAEFENNYDIFSNDKIKALEIFTSEIIDEINNFRINFGKPIQIRIKNGKLYFNAYLRRNIRTSNI